MSLDPFLMPPRTIDAVNTPLLPLLLHGGLNQGVEAPDAPGRTVGRPELLASAPNVVIAVGVWLLLHGWCSLKGGLESLSRLNHARLERHISHTDRARSTAISFSGLKELLHQRQHGGCRRFLLPWRGKNGFELPQ
jgi:hypothetical protein